jgi:hypothetical protein
MYKQFPEINPSKELVLVVSWETDISDAGIGSLTQVSFVRFECWRVICQFILKYMHSNDYNDSGASYV